MDCEPARADYGRATRKSWRPGFHAEVAIYFIAPFVLFALIAVALFLLAPRFTD
jgi:hypothetical protein